MLVLSGIQLGNRCRSRRVHLAGETLRRHHTLAGGIQTEQSAWAKLYQVRVDISASSGI